VQNRSGGVDGRSISHDNGGLIKYAGVVAKKGKAKQGYEVVLGNVIVDPKKPTRLIKIFRCCWWKMVNM